MIERKIKELSIALEALSRIQGYESARHFSDVSDLLGTTIKEAKEYNSLALKVPPQPLNLDDDNIPF